MITVFTPTYNRAYILPALYNSLCCQTDKDFEWIVVDDGSTDRTQALIQQFQQENKISIKYFKTRNSGKHVAINFGVAKADSELFFIVDSDDNLTSDAISTIKTIFNRISSDKTFCGISGVRIDFEGNCIGGKFPSDKIDSNAIDIRLKYQFRGDLAEVYRTDVLKEFPFPIYEKERFLTEAIVWNRIASAGYKIRYTDKGFYRCEYRPDGLTAKMTRLRMENPIGATSYYSEYIGMQIPFKEKIKTAINFWRFASCIKNISFAKKTKKIGVLWLPFAVIGYFFHLNDTKSIR